MQVFIVLPSKMCTRSGSGMPMSVCVSLGCNMHHRSREAFDVQHSEAMMLTSKKGVQHDAEKSGAFLP